MTTPETLGLRAFARHLKKKASYISQLKGEGRLVLTDCGKFIRVAESIQRIQDTMDPAKFAVVERHAANRNAKQANVQPQGQNDTQSDTEDQSPELSNNPRYQDSKAVREEYLAKSAKRDYELSIGKLMHADDVLAVISAAVVSLRSRFESMPDILAAQLVALNDESQVRTALADAIEHALEETSRQFASVAKKDCA